MKKGTISLLTSSWSYTGWKHHVIASTLGCVAISSLLLLAACGGDSGSDADAPNKVEVVSSIYSLGDCTSEFDGDTVFVKDEKADYVCLSGKWVNIDSTDSRIRENDEEGRKNDESSSSVIPGIDPESSSSVVDDPLNDGSSSSVRASYIEVPIKEQLGTCDASLMGLRTLVLADSSYFTCKANGWAKDETYLGYDIVPTKEDLPQCHAGNAKQRVLVKKDSVFFRCDSVKWVPETADGYIVKNASILGAAQKGPFKFDSPLTLREVLLHDDALTYTGREYIDEISSNKGDFVIPKVNLVYPYAVLEVRGLWRNEVTGEWSKDSMTLRALTDLTTRTEVNINLLTHLEYDRAARLVNKGYSVFAAKKQAEYEIMTAFGFATTVEYSEDLKTFVPSTSENYGENATLMAISLLFIGDRSEAEILKAIGDFKQDVAADGEWNDAQTKADMADWAEAFDGGSVRANVKSWNILDIPDYENYLTIYWNNAYELGGCSATRSGVIAQNKNSKSKNYNVHYICKVNSWQKATDFEKDTYEWADGEEGEVKKGNVTATYYVFENGKWTVTKNETALGLCTESRNGEVGKIDTTYFICDNKNWRKATVLEYDTDGWSAGIEGEVKPGSIFSSNHYTYADGAWRATVNDMEYEFGACVASRSNEKHIQSGKYYICENKTWKQITAEEYGLGYCTTSNNGVVELLNDVYYICKSGSWTTATVLEYDTYGWSSGTEGEVKVGSVISSNHYTYADGAWRATVNGMEYEFGACVASRSNEKHIQSGKYYICENKTWKQITAEEYGLGYCTASNNGVVEMLNDVYYICKSGSWVTATVFEYDTYGWSSGTEGEVKVGSVISSNHYTYAGGAWRATVNDMEYEFGACVASRSNEKHIQSGKYYICENKTWKQITAEEYGLGYCSASNNGVVEMLNDVYYICKSGSWVTATVLEYDTYGKTCLTDGTIVSGEVITSNKYVCDASSFRVANEQEIALNKGCVNYTENEIVKKQISDTQDSIYTCKSGLWTGSVGNHIIVYGTMTDARDGKTYKTIVIGTQTWMAENLNYSDYPGMVGQNWCLKNSLDGCDKYGRFYPWAAAMDSAGTFTTNGKNCGNGRACSPTYPVRGICPEGWHLPDTTEWNTLFTAVGGISTAGKMLKSQTGWSAYSGIINMDAYGFSALPAGGRNYYGGFFSDGNSAHFWSATVSGRFNAYYVDLKYDDDNAVLYDTGREYGYSVRCLKDSAE